MYDLDRRLPPLPCPPGPLCFLSSRKLVSRPRSPERLPSFRFLLARSTQFHSLESSCFVPISESESNSLLGDRKCSNIHTPCSSTARVTVRKVSLLKSRSLVLVLVFGQPPYLHPLESLSPPREEVVKKVEALRKEEGKKSRVQPPPLSPPARPRASTFHPLDPP